MMESFPAFFKFFIATVNNNDMKLPTAYTKRMEEALPEKVHFRDRFDNIWTVNVQRDGDDWYFLGNGWVKFVEDNELESGDLLVFEYFRKGWFRMRIYGKSCNEKEGPGPIMSKREMTDDEVLIDIESNNYNKEIKTENEDDYIKAATIRENDKGSDNNGNDFEGEYSTESEEYVSSFIRQNNELERYHHVADDGERYRPNTGAGSSRSIIPKPEDFTARCYGVELFRAGLAEQPINPYFVTKIQKARKADLFVPKNIIKDFDIDFTQVMHFVDPKGRTFHAKCKLWKDGRVVISGGWKSLCCVNLVDNDDLCICEFVQGEGRHLLIKVTVVRSDRFNA